MEDLFTAEFQPTNLIIPNKGLQIIELLFQPGIITTDLLKKEKLAIPHNFCRMKRKRRNEYLAGRICARIAIDKLSVNPCKSGLLPQCDRTPDWPNGIIGSISHNYSTATAIACVAKTSMYHNIGIDIETVVNKKTSSTIKETLLSINELKSLRKFFSFKSNDEELITLIFSAKESLFKALYKDVGFIFGFEVVTIRHIDNERIYFVLQLGLSSGWRKGDTIGVNYRFTTVQIYTWLIIGNSTER